MAVAELFLEAVQSQALGGHPVFHAWSEPFIPPRGAQVPPRGTGEEFPSPGPLERDGTVAHTSAPGADP